MVKIHNGYFFLLLFILRYSVPHWHGRILHLCIKKRYFKCDYRLLHLSLSNQENLHHRRGNPSPHPFFILYHYYTVSSIPRSAREMVERGQFLFLLTRRPQKVPLHLPCAHVECKGAISHLVDVFGYLFPSPKAKLIFSAQCNELGNVKMGKDVPTFASVGIHTWY